MSDWDLVGEGRTASRRQRLHTVEEVRKTEAGPDFPSSKDLMETFKWEKTVLGPRSGASRRSGTEEEGKTRRPKADSRQSL
jgi:hypothetical protein